MFEHGRYAALVVVGIAIGEGIADIGQGPQVRMADLLDHGNDEERVLVVKIVVFEIDQDVLSRSILSEASQSLRSQLDIRFDAA